MEITVMAPPIRFNQDGVALVGATRVFLSAVIHAFHQGDSPEQIVDSYDVLALADVYAVIAYYLQHRTELDAYFDEELQRDDLARHELEIQHPELFTLQNRLRALKSVLN
jgi:uncharacterized protein (DUF433 family)